MIKRFSLRKEYYFQVKMYIQSHSFYSLTLQVIPSSETPAQLCREDTVRRSNPGKPREVSRLINHTAFSCVSSLCLTVVFKFTSGLLVVVIIIGMHE